MLSKISIEEQPANDSAIPAVIWGAGESKSRLVARNLVVKYSAIGIELVLGVFLLPFNVTHLGAAAYGLLALTASITAYFSMLDFGYGLAQEKFVAHYRALKDGQALNEVVSTLFIVFAAIGLLALVMSVAIAFNLQRLFNLTPNQSQVGRNVLLVVGLYVALSFPFSVFGGIVNGFVRNYMNGWVAITTSLLAAAVNVVILSRGYGLLELVVGVYSVRAAAYWFYRRNAYRVFPGLRVHPHYFSRSRLKEVTGFSVFILLIDLANKINYSTDAIVVGVFLGPASVAVWTVAQRLIETTQKVTNQLNGSLFPVVVDSAALGSQERLQRILIQGTKLSLAMVIPVATALGLLARSLVTAWVGDQFLASVIVIYLLAVVVVIRVGNATATTLLKGSGQHKTLALCNVGMSLANLALSVALVSRYGLAGVAVGTLIPVGAVSAFVIFPFTCRKVELSIRRVMRLAVWPAVWPALAMCVVLIATSGLFPASLASVFGRAVLAGASYGAIFLLLAVNRADRDWYLESVRLLVRRERVPAAA